VTVLETVLSAHTSAGSRSPLISVDVERAVALAEASAKRWAEGKTLGPLDGLIIPVKDEFHMTGLPTRGGAPYHEEPATTDAWVVRSLIQAGAIVVGKAHATEWGMNPCGILEHFVGPRNVYSDEHAPGGSSTGSGVAVGLGWCPSSVGSDGGGSIRIPASLNGVFGLKPTFIRIGRTGDIWSNSTVAHIGPIGRSTTDIVEQLSATAGVDIDDPLTRWAPDAHNSKPWTTALTRGIKGARIGVIRGELDDASPAIAAQIRTALAALEADGATLVDVDIPLAHLVNGIGALVIASETVANVGDLYDAKSADFGDEMAIIMELIRRIDVNDMQRARRSRAALRRQVATALADVDILALPTTGKTAPTYASTEDKIGVLDSAATAAMTRFNFLGNLTGLPSGSVPIGLDNGLPVGLQFVGDAWDEASVIAAMAHCERLGLCDLPAPPGLLSLAE
jgi:aspartyl-tRNA(Asn)/glutamyl-tRNA(Gln) amidotransferase subunit A